MKYETSIRYKKSGVPVLSDKEIERHAEQFIKEFDNSMFKDPHELDIERFMEYHLGLELEYNNLTHCGLILGRMVFNDTNTMPIYDAEKRRAEYISVTRGTVMLDNTLLEDEHRLRSTIGHECGHWVYHKPYYTYDLKQLSLFDNPEQLATACRRDDVEGCKRKLITDHDWLEHHAKYFSAAMLMPKKAVMRVLSRSDYSELVHDFCFGTSCADRYLINEISKIFNVSMTSASIRLNMLKEALIEEIVPNPITRFIVIDNPLEVKI